MWVDLLSNMQRSSRRGVSSAFVIVFIVIITTITIINCQEIVGSTVRTSLTDIGFINQNSYVSTTVSNDPNHFFNSDPTDACSINQTLVISHTPVKLKAFTGQQLCSFLLTTNQRVGLSVAILHSGLKSAYSYFYTEVLGNETTPCSGQYLHASDDSTPCMAIIKGSHFRFSFQNTEIIFEVRVEDLEMRDCFKGSDTITSCNITLYQSQIGQKGAGVLSSVDFI